MDSDDELEMLQRQLMQVQEQKTNPLSDRTVAQILIKLQQNGFKFYTTTDNNQYITPQQIDTQIIRIINERGRLSLAILPQLLNLNQDLIESRINGICNKSTHIRHNSWLMSKDYIENLLLSIKQKLEMLGLVELDQEALKYQFDIKFMEKIVGDRIDEFDADLSDHHMTTREYMRMQKKKVLGFLLAITRPIQVSTIAQHLLTKQQKKDLTANKIENIVRQLVSENQIKGKYQNLFYIPDRFSKNQKSFIVKFLQNNGYLQYSMLQKNYMVPKPEEWIKKNLDSQIYTVFQGICFRKSLLVSYQNQLESLMKGDGFAEIGSVIPFDLQQKKMNKFLTENCQLKNFILNQGICYSKDWIEKCVNQFKHRVIFDIFFNDQKGKKQSKGSKKKATKKQKSVLTEQQLIQTLFDAGLAEYSVAENIVDSLLPVLIEQLELSKTKIQKQLAQNQGVISSKFLQYKKCKTIVRSEQNLTRTLKMIDKQKKKAGQWHDPDFGPIESDQNGQYSLIFYDKIVPKEWPAIQNIKWKPFNHQELFKTQPQKSKFMSKSLLFEMMEILDCYNRISQNKINTPILETQAEQSPYYFKFYITREEHRYVLVDNQIPYLCIRDQENQHENNIQFASAGVYGMVEKAYSKFRYCYKALLSVPFHQLVTELTGAQKIQKLDLSDLKMNNIQSVNMVIKKIEEQGWSQNKMIIFMAQGKQGKRADTTTLQQNEAVFCLKPYLAIFKEQNLLLLPNKITIKINQQLFNTFNNVWIITP